jgi:hypothetical protein
VLFETAVVHLGHFVFQRVGMSRLRLGEHAGSETHGDGYRNGFSFFRGK